MNPGDHPLACGAVIKGQHRDTAGHGLESHIAKGLGEAGEKQQVG